SSQHVDQYKTSVVSVFIIRDSSSSPRTFFPPSAFNGATWTTSRRKKCELSLSLSLSLPLFLFLSFRPFRVLGA
ncbi:hypothetical protein ALC56_06186, partial [Trachymyrmex septentrionalis]